MSYNSIRIERERGGFTVRATDPAIEKANNNRKGSDSPCEWRDPSVEFLFETKEQVVAFVEKAIDIALPPDEFTSAFDKLAKDVKGEKK